MISGATIREWGSEVGWGKKQYRVHWWTDYLPVWAIGAASLWEHGETAGNHLRGSEIRVCIHQLPPATEHCSLWGANPWNCGVPHAGAGHALATVECGMPSGRAIGACIRHWSSPGQEMSRGHGWGWRPLLLIWASQQQRPIPTSQFWNPEALTLFENIFSHMFGTKIHLVAILTWVFLVFIFSIFYEYCFTKNSVIFE